MSTTSRGPSRRTLVKGAAWSVPVVAVASQAPAMAASPVIVFNTGVSCRDSADNELLFVFNTTLPAGTNVTVTSWIWYPNDGATGVEEFGPVSTTVTDSGTLVYGFDIDGNTQGRLEICFSWSGQGVPDDADCIDTMVNSFENCSGPPSGYPQRSPGPSSGMFDPPILEWPAGLQAQDASLTSDETVDPAAENESAPAEDTARVAEPAAPPVEDTAKTESTTPVAPSTDAGTTDEASTTAQP